MMPAIRRLNLSGLDSASAAWRRATPSGRSNPPKALESGHGFKPILMAVTTREAIYSLVKSLIDRGHANSSDQRMVAVFSIRSPGNLHTGRYV